MLSLWHWPFRQDWWHHLIHLVCIFFGNSSLIQGGLLLWGWWLPAWVINSWARSISPGYPGPVKVSVLNWDHGQAFAEHGRENISLSLPFVLVCCFSVFFSGMCPQLRQDCCFRLAGEDEICAVNNALITKEAFTFLYISIASSALQSCQLELVMFAMNFFLFLPLQIFSALCHKAAYFTLKPA